MWRGMRMQDSWPVIGRDFRSATLDNTVHPSVLQSTPELRCYSSDKDMRHVGICHFGLQLGVSANHGP